jgi:hypothetical protein
LDPQHPNAPCNDTPSNDVLLWIALAILVVGFVVFIVLMFASRRRIDRES